ncbi:MAG: glycosyltransferase family 2 protein [Aphanothece sp. CMT-3BRIN-NPC111]|jgi:glycosyltransferase involved in cell wall biosynthesis|nr:glycosyltransferase family 2 protein [Aphanothece sp. CMT-3BRIN-NPC111]
MISVVIPAYNASKFIEPAIESILKQTFQEFEVIVVDDGSTDNTLEILKRYSEQDARVRVIQCEHGGLSRALNRGIGEAKYPWIARMDADDIALPERFQKQIDAAATNPHVVAWGTYAHHINSKGKILSLARSGTTTEKEFNDLRSNGHLVQLIHPTVLLKKEVLLKIGGYKTEFEPVEELELFDRMAEYGPTLAIPEPLLLYRVHSGSVSMQRFFFQRLLMRYVVARHRSRLAGHEELSFEQFLQDYQQQPLLSRLKRHLKTSGMFCYRKAGLSFGEGEYLQACFYLSLSAALNPGYSLARVWNQVFSPKTQRWLKPSNHNSQES